MAVTEIRVEAPAERCFEVLSDPRSFAYWVVGSRAIRDADPDWPAVGSKFEHIVGHVIQDHTVVEELEENRMLRLRARARPFGTAFVTVTMQPEDGGARLRLEEEPADRVSRLLHNRVADRLLRARNVGSLERLKELAEGSAEVPTGEHPGTTQGTPQPSGRLRTVSSLAAEGFGRGFLAGIAGGAAMSVSTVAEMKLTRRPPSAAPARAIEKIFAIEKLGEDGERRLGGAAHFAVSGLTGGAWGAIAASEVPGPTRAPLLYALAVTPDTALVPALGLAPPPWRWSAADAARTVVHHAVYTAVASRTFLLLKA